MEGASPESGLLLGAVLLLAVSGVPGLFARKGGSGGERLAAVLACAGSTLGLVAAARILFLGADVRLTLSSPLPGGPILVAADALSALFLLPVFLVPALGAVYGLGYWPEAEHLRDGRKLRFFMGLLAASMARRPSRQERRRLPRRVGGDGARRLLRRDGRGPAAGGAGGGLDLPRRDARRDARTLRDDGRPARHDRLVRVGRARRRASPVPARRASSSSSRSSASAPRRGSSRSTSGSRARTPARRATSRR